MAILRNRNSQKPDKQLIRRFQQSFPDVARRVGRENVPETPAGINNATVVGVDTMADLGHGSTLDDDMKLLSSWTPRQWQHLRVPTPCMDPDFAASSLMPGGQQFGVGTPGIGPILHNQAGDLHTPTMGLNGTPLPFPSYIDPSALTDGGLEQYYDPPLFGQRTPGLNPYVQQATDASGSLMRYDSGSAAAGDASVLDSSSLGETRFSLASNAKSSTGLLSDKTSPLNAKDRNFRYSVFLQVPTAMVKNAWEVSETYLNKGQAYTLTVKDSTPPVVPIGLIQYRTFIRISFEGEEKRSNPIGCWRLWMESRGKNEAHRRGGEPRAIEYLDDIQDGGGDNTRGRVDLQQAFFDGFCITWTADPSASTSECSIPLRFNFLSTDFSHAKGVKGVPVRLCVKTELLSPKNDVGMAHEPEVCYRKVKLFRDHGAGRKFTNDVRHANKTIDKLNQRITEAERGAGSAKRRRVNSVSGSMAYPGYHATSDAKGSEIHDLQADLASTQYMLSSARSVSDLDLRGNKEDDPDLYPIRLSSDGGRVQVEARGRQSLSRSNLSPSDSKISPVSRTSSFEAVDVDPSYRAPSGRPPKPTACFYARFAGEQSYYRAIYLMERTVQELAEKLSAKRQIDPKYIVHVLHINKNGLPVVVDDDVVRELPEGQAMTVDVCDATGIECNDAAGSSTSPLEIKLIY